MVYLANNLREYGNQPFRVVVLHGGPGAPGEMATTAQELSLKRGVLEPLQTSDSVEGQVEELRAVLQQFSQPPVILIGFSWGAWLGFIGAATFPEMVGKLILISSGPFEEKYVREIMSARLSRMRPEEKAEVLALMEAMEKDSGGDEDKFMQRLGELLDKADSFDPILQNSEKLECDSRIYRKVWREANRLRSSGELLELGKKIPCPVLAIHGDYDPHPYQGVQKPLARVLKGFRFILLEKCGHKPWIEKAARDKFYEVLKREINS